MLLKTQTTVGDGQDADLVAARRGGVPLVVADGIAVRGINIVEAGGGADPDTAAGITGMALMDGLFRPSGPAA